MSAPSVVVFAITLSLATAAAQQEPPRPPDPSQPLAITPACRELELAVR